MNTSATGRLRVEPDAGPKSPVAALRCAFCLSAIPVAYGIALEIDRLDRSPHLFVLLVAISLCTAYAGPKARWAGSALAVVCAIYLLGPVTRMPELTLLLLFTVAVLVLNFTASNYGSLERDMAYQRDEFARRLDVRTAELEQTNERLKAETRRRAVAEEELRTAREVLARKVGPMTGAELAAAVAHEINQPITGLITQCAAATNWLDRTPPDVEEARNSVAAATGCAERVAEVVHRVRKLMAGEPIRTDLVDVNEVVRSAVGLLQSRDGAGARERPVGLVRASSSGAGRPNRARNGNAQSSRQRGGGHGEFLPRSQPPGGTELSGRYRCLSGSGRHRAGNSRGRRDVPAFLLDQGDGIGSGSFDLPQHCPGAPRHDRLQERRKQGRGLRGANSSRSLWR